MSAYWPAVPNCGDYALEGRATCGRPGAMRFAGESSQGWRVAAHARPERVCFSVYEDLIQDEVGHLHRLSQFAGLEESIERIEHACTNVKRGANISNINIGRRGRGREALSPRQIDRIHSILDAVGADKEVTEYLVEGVAASTLFGL